MPNETKFISIVVTGAREEIRDVDIIRGCTVRDLLEKLNLVGALSKVGSAAPFGPNDDIFSQVKDGEKLILSPNAPVADR